MVTMTIAMLEGVKSSIGCTAWPHALQHAALIKNIVPHSTLPPDVSPFELWTGNKLSVSTIRTFGCKATLTIPDKQRDKLANRSITGLHLGLAIGKKAFIIYDLLTRRIHESRDVHFFEGSSDSEHVTIEVPGMESPTHVVHGSDDVTSTEGRIEERDKEGVDEGNGDGDAEETSGPLPVEPCRSGRERRGRMRDDDDRYFVSSYNRSHQTDHPHMNREGTCYAYLAHTDVLQTYNDAMDRHDADSWLEACQDELLSLKET